MPKDSPCYQCPDRFPGCSGSCQKPEYIEEQRKKREVKERILKEKVKDGKLTKYAVDVALKNKKQYRRGK